nr:E3 ubiquitin-protein ligase RNF170 isoform X2 [Parasteatoda tepidariorum]
MTNRPRHFSPDQICPVCLARPNYPVETNCGHLFCAQCVITYWRHGNWIGAIKCPVCRAVVTAIMPCFRPEQVQSSPEGTRIVNEVNDYNRRYSGEPRPWLDYLWDLPTLLRHAGSEFFSFGGIMYMFRLRILLCFVAAIMYLISPLDMIPEAVFGILGLLDDMFVLLLVAIYVTVIYRRFLATRWENQQTQN